MRVQEIVSTIVKPGRTEKWLRIALAAVVMSAIAFVGFGAAARAGGMTQLSGIGVWAEEGECTALDPADYDLAIKFVEGDLIGCVYITVLTDESSPSGTYRETGTEFYDIVGGTFGTGTFSTTYRFEAKFDDSGAEIFGRCQHPLVAGTGTGDFEGVSGRIDMKDDVETGEFLYRGHLGW
jgi:hypothetical protein